MSGLDAELNVAARRGCWLGFHAFALALSLRSYCVLEAYSFVPFSAFDEWAPSGGEGWILLLGSLLSVLLGIAGLFTARQGFRFAVLSRRGVHEAWAGVGLAISSWLVLLTMLLGIP